MKHYGYTLIKALLAVVLFASIAQASTSWHSRSRLETTEKGMMEIPILPGLHSQAGTNRLDLSLIGPDGNSRAFELYMRGKDEIKRVDLLPEQIRLTNTGSVIWEAIAPDMTVNTLSVLISDSTFIGKVTVSGLKGSIWKTLAENEALYKTDDVSRADITLEPGMYDRLRLTFSSFNRKYRKQILPIKQVTATSVIHGKPVSAMTMPMTFTRVEMDEIIDVKSRLQGSGLYIKTVTLKTESPYIGKWQLGREEIRNGILIFRQVTEGVISHVIPGKQGLSIKVDQRWKGNSLILRLFPQETYIGDITAFNLDINVPRLFFSVDKKGTYHLLTGRGTPQRIHDYSLSDTYDVDTTAALSEVEINTARTIRDLVEAYPLKGGPFHEKGYAYRSQLPVSEPGYYRLRLHRNAGLDNNRRSFRIVHDGIQVPFLFSFERENSIPLTPVRNYSGKTNRTTWEIALPETSRYWKKLTLKTSGMFKRDVVFSLKKPGNTGWKPWQSRHWISNSQKAATLSVPLGSLFNEKKSLQIQMDHKDNQALELDSIEAAYSSVDLLFLAHVPGDYFLYGGNPDVSAPSYDLSLIEDKLLESLPEEITMPEPVMLRSSHFKDTLTGLFLDNSWGLYIILAIVTLILMGVVVKLFPKQQE